MSNADKILLNENFNTFYYIRFINSYHSNLKIYIQFDKKMHTVEICGSDVDKFERTLFLDLAINEKVKELGWI